MIDRTATGRRPERLRRRRTGGAAPAWTLAVTLAVVLVPGAAAQEALPDTLDLEGALRIAVTRNPQLRVAQAQADQAGAARQAAWGAFLPTASASLGLNRNDFTRTTFLGEEGESETLPEPLSSQSQSASQGVSLNWTLLDGGRRFAALSEQSASVRASQRRVDDQRLAVIANAARAYYQALRRQQLIDFTARQIEDRELELEIARRRYAIAAVERRDVLQAESNLLQAQIALLGEESQLDIQRRELAVALGLPAHAAESTVLRDIVAMPDASGLAAESLVQRALSSDPELLAYEADRTAASAALWGARSRYLPTISLGVNWSRGQQYGPDASFFQFDPDDTSRSFSVNVSWSLFDGFQREQQNAVASSQKRVAEESLRLRRLEIEREVRRFVSDLGRLGREIELLERSREISQERLAMTREMYRLGTIDFTALQQSITDVTSAERQLIERRFDYLVAWTSLEEYAGNPSGSS